MSFITLNATKRFDETRKELVRLTKSAVAFTQIYERYGQKGVDLLSQATPKYTGLASSSWRYEIKEGPTSTMITWHNDDIENGYNVVILIVYGHGLHNGGYVAGRDFIDPLIQPMFDQMIEDLWKEVCG